MMCLIFTSITLQGDQNSEWKRHHKWFEKPFLWKFYETPSDKSSHGGFLHKKAVLGNLAKLTGKNLSQSLFFNKAAGQNVQTKCPTKDKRRKTDKSLIFFVSPFLFICETLPYTLYLSDTLIYQNVQYFFQIIEV